MSDFEKTLAVGEKWRTEEEIPELQITDRILLVIGCLFFAQALPLVLALSLGGC